MINRILIMILAAGLIGGTGYSQSLNTDIQKLTADAAPDVRNFYERNGYVTAWTNNKNVIQLMTAIRTIENDGLDPEHYNLAFLEQLTNDFSDERGRATLDITLTDAFIKLAHDLYQGRLDPDKLFPGDWEACIQTTDYGGLLFDALDRGSVCETLDFLRPMDNGYEGLRYMLGNFREIYASGGFPEILIGRDIHPGDTDDRMASIRTTLYLLKIIPEGLANESIVYDSTLIFAIQEFQQMHSLSQDGVIGRRTQQALALTAADYVETIVVNLERYRWHQSRLIDRSVRINIPTATLTLSDGEKMEMQMKVIIGRKDRRTPVLSSVFNLITINPTWTIPPTILKEDVLPAIVKDPGYLARHKIRVINRKGIEVNPDSVQWSTLSAARFPYTLREDPGAQNPLGLIKFSFPNDYSVYLHDTNMPSLFSNQDRTLSSGCIRIESPMALVRVLIEGSGWTEEMVRDEIQKGETKMVLLKNTLPLHITYFTAFVNNDELIVAKDVYQYDKIVMNALLGTCKSRL